VTRFLTDSRFNKWRFPEVTGAELGPHLAGGLVEPQLMTSWPALSCVIPRSTRAQDRILPLWLVGGVKKSLHKLTHKFQDGIPVVYNVWEVKLDK